MLIWLTPSPQLSTWFMDALKEHTRVLYVCSKYAGNPPFALRFCQQHAFRDSSSTRSSITKEKYFSLYFNKCVIDKNDIL